MYLTFFVPSKICGFPHDAYRRFFYNSGRSIKDEVDRYYPKVDQVISIITTKTVCTIRLKITWSLNTWFLHENSSVTSPCYKVDSFIFLSFEINYVGLLLVQFTTCFVP